MIDKDCPRCGKPLDLPEFGNVELHVCPGCGFILDKPIKTKDKTEDDSQPRKYRKLLEGKYAIQ